MLILSEKEKNEMCIELGRHLPKIRELLRLSQKEFALRCGISVPRLSVIENGHHIMSWAQLTSILFICSVNKSAKEYFFANHVLNARLIQYVQMKDENIPPEINVCVDEAIVTAYSKEYLKKLTGTLPQQEIMSQQKRMSILDITSREVLFEYRCIRNRRHWQKPHAAHCHLLSVRGLY